MTGKNMEKYTEKEKVLCETREELHLYNQCVLPSVLA